ncbi:LysR substrate-binding domain-containing protein [Pseudooceanicola algae]|uniref:Glycine cleavage system transcriptional activator n=1 Tax=Pseudooceanicola algae TaxID=1537215 RepID=A0A418SHM9_9RHOB|nr:LysR substrate-binding domain-containing protein [Pseudooceanicola algae]QPM90292.1 Glycine cleavage system transcriptional activator [Pseudooceanicola algae]
MRRTPSTQALRALESFARLGTVWQAAEDLHLTKSAVTHQLRLLERDLGFPMLNRAGARLELTPLGRGFARDIRKALDLISAAAARSGTQGVSGEMTLSCPPGIASNWLCTFIDGFAQAYPDVILNITTPRRLNDVSNPEADVFIAFGREFPGDVDVELLQRIDFTPVCSPAYLNRHDGFADLRSLQKATLLHLDAINEWVDWMRLVGMGPETAQHGIRFTDMNLVYSAALAGQGVALGDEFVCGEALARGALVRPFDVSLPTESAYYLVTPSDRAENSVVATFLGWLRGALRNRYAE